MHVRAEDVIVVQEGTKSHSEFYKRDVTVGVRSLRVFFAHKSDGSASEMSGVRSLWELLADAYDEHVRAAQEESYLF